MITLASHRTVRTLSALFGAAAVALCACAHERDVAPDMTMTTGAVVSSDAAIDQLAHARCERASECNLFGSGRPYADKNECLSGYRERGSVMRADECPYGIDKKRLDKCVASLQAEACLEHMGPISSLPECNRSICVR